MECDICNNWIADEFGNNDEPIFKGKCCDECNWVFVVPARLNELARLDEF